MEPLLVQNFTILTDQVALASIIIIIISASKWKSCLAFGLPVLLETYPPGKEERKKVLSSISTSPVILSTNLLNLSPEKGSVDGFFLPISGCGSTLMKGSVARKLK
jgi:hypothetical protein